MKEEGKVAWRCTNFTCPAQAVTGITISVPVRSGCGKHRLFRGPEALRSPTGVLRAGPFLLMPDQLAT
ncbi:MAG: hypothetical protein ACLSUW_02180 [Akkermansia sp.]